MMAKKSLQLGRAVEWPDAPEKAKLDRVPNPQAGTNYLVRFTAPEFTSLCPVTGQPDFAHLVIAFCRALDIPSRYISGYALGLEPPDFHGYAQVYLGGGWHDVDATFDGTRPALVPIAVGRDAADVAMATVWGRSTVVEQAVEVSEAPA